MSWSNKLAGTPYGALELKITYQRNLLRGNAVAFLIAASAVAAVYLFSQNPVEIRPPVQPIDDKGGHVILPPPNPPTVIIETKPKIPQPPRDLSGVVSTNPVPIPDSLYSGNENNTISSQDDLRRINERLDSTLPGNGSKFVYTFPDTTEDWPETGAFIICERYPEMISTPKPEYPRIAKTTQTEGDVWVQVLVDEKGEPLDVRISKDSGTNVGFEQAALEAAWKCRFSPGIQNGKPVKVWVVFKIEFTLESNY